MITRFLLCSALLLASGALLGQETDQLPAETPARSSQVDVGNLDSRQ